MGKDNTATDNKLSVAVCDNHGIAASVIRAQEDKMDFVSIRIITDQIKPLVAFYETITGLSATWFTPDFAELERGAEAAFLVYPRRGQQADPDTRLDE